ncbi:acyl-CoA thioesterase [Paraflavitalea pollutisoli]|uniref:acyl-CoA thioesterase n=1 Tax=Paraflavitalea pollutisoli TaxID=3034143 RepID=UPI0023ED1C44|nr:thioesterase family protein [Paraflavitalea sp. H1-2-19X]
MARIKVDLPAEFAFTTQIPVRITDLNYGGHVGNDTILSILHEARVQFIQHHGYTELKLAGVGLIMSDVAIEFKQELFYPDNIRASVTAGDLTKVSFDLYYKLEKIVEGKTILVAAAKTGMVCFDYEKKKVAAVPGEVIEKFGL